MEAKLSDKTNEQLSQALLDILKGNAEAVRPTLTPEQELTIRAAAFQLDVNAMRLVKFAGTAIELGKKVYGEDFEGLWDEKNSKSAAVTDMSVGTNLPTIDLKLSAVEPEDIKGLPTKS